MCAFDIFHFLPLVAIVLTALLKTIRNSAPVVCAALSIFGLLAGMHVHLDHHTHLSLIDPCVMYTITLAVSVAIYSKKRLNVFSNKKA